jgi:hypothetical protein
VQYELRRRLIVAHVLASCCRDLSFGFPKVSFCDCYPLCQARSRKLSFEKLHPERENYDERLLFRKPALNAGNSNIDAADGECCELRI